MGHLLKFTIYEFIFLKVTLLQSTHLSCIRTPSLQAQTLGCTQFYHCFLCVERNTYFKFITFATEIVFSKSDPMT